LLLIEADARLLPLHTRCAGRVQAIEALAYLNEDYAEGLRECIRLLADDGRLLVADRDYEAGLLTRLFYSGGIRGLLEATATRDIWDGNADRVVRSRCFTASEFVAMMQDNGLRVLSHVGVSALSLIVGHEQVGGRIEADEETCADELRTLLRKLSRTGQMRRS